MDARPKRLRPGDVLQLNTREGIAHLQYIGRHPEYGDALLVNPKLGTCPKVVTGELFSDSYVAFYPAAAAVAQGLVRVIGHLEPPKLPQRLRRPGARSGRGIETWIIEDGADATVKWQLSQEELKLPIAVIWNHELLTQRVLERWNPVHEGSRQTSDDTRAVAELSAVSDADAPHLILHYVYLPSSEAADWVAAELRNRGFSVEQRLGADGVNWLVLARHRAVPSEALMASTRSSMETLVEKFGGEYDGWEAEVTGRDSASPTQVH